MELSVGLHGVTLHQGCLTSERLARITLCSVNISACWWWTAQDWSKVSWEPVYGPCLELKKWARERNTLKKKGIIFYFCCCCWWIRSGGGRLHMKQPWTQKMDKTIAWKQAERGNCMVCFRAYLITVKLKWRKKWENGDVVRRRREEEPEWRIKNIYIGKKKSKSMGIWAAEE